MTTRTDEAPPAVAQRVAGAPPGDRGRSRWIAAALLIAATIAAPFVVGTGNGYTQTLLVMACIYVTFTLGQTLLLGFAGQVSLGHAAFYGLGAYTAAVLSIRLEWSVLVIFPISMVVPAALAWLIGRRLLRFQPFYLAMATLIVGIIATEVFNTWVAVTNGPTGLYGIPSPEVLGFAFDTPLRMYWLSAAVMLVALGASASLMSSYVGRSMRAIRSDPATAASCGVNVERHKNRIFALSAALAGAAGALYAYLTSFISPETFGIDLSVLVVAMAVIGGLGNVGGAVIGAIFLVVFPEFTRQYGEWRDLIYGLVLFAVLVFLPRGLWGLCEDAVRRVGRILTGARRPTR